MLHFSKICIYFVKIKIRVYTLYLVVTYKYINHIRGFISHRFKFTYAEPFFSNAINIKVYVSYLKELQVKQ